MSTVDSGRIGYFVAGEPERFAGPGETAHFSAGVPRRFWNAGDTEAMISGAASPPHNMEWFLTQVYASVRRARRPPESLRRRLPDDPLPQRIRR